MNLLTGINPGWAGLNFIASIISLRVLVKFEDKSLCIKNTEPCEPAFSIHKAESNQSMQEDDTVLKDKQLQNFASLSLCKEEKADAFTDETLETIKERLAELPHLYLDNTFSDLQITAVGLAEHQFIPEISRLAEATLTKNKDNNCKIASIGKLLVNQRDLENIIEANALLQHTDNIPRSPRVISSESGKILYQKLNLILSEHEEISDLAFIDRNGYIISGLIKNQEKEQIIGAIFCSIFSTLENYLNQINISLPLKIYFEFQNERIFLKQLKDKFVFIAAESGFEFIDYSYLKEVFNRTHFLCEENQIKALNSLKL